MERQYFVKKNKDKGYKGEIWMVRENLSNKLIYFIGNSEPIMVDLPDFM